MNGKDLLRLVGLLKSADPKDLETAINDIEALGKSEPRPEGAPHIRDQFEPGGKHEVPTREEILTGPGQSASGSGAERMIREYSSPAPQRGVQVDAEKLERLLEDFRGYVGKAQDLIGKLGAAILAKASEEEEREKDEDEDDVAEKSATRAKRLIEKAKRLLAKAEEKEDEEDDEKDAAKAHELKLEAKRLRKKASRLLGDAHFAAFALAGTIKGRGEGAELLKSIRAIASKADVDVKHEDKDDDEEEGDGKSRAAAGGAVTVKNEGTDRDKGNQSPSQDRESGNQDDAAAKAVQELQAKVDELTAQLKGKQPAAEESEAIKGLKVQLGSISTLLEAMSGQARPGANGTGAAKPDFAFVKAGTTVEDTIDEIGLKIDAAADSGEFSTFEVVSARNILAKVDAVQKGALPRAVLENAIALAKPSVQELFKPVAA